VDPDRLNPLKQKVKALSTHGQHRKSNPMTKRYMIIPMTMQRRLMAQSRNPKGMMDSREQTHHPGGKAALTLQGVSQ